MFVAADQDSPLVDISLHDAGNLNIHLLKGGGPLNRYRALMTVIGVVGLSTACGEDNDQSAVVANSTSNESITEAPDSLEPVSTSGDPRDLISLSSFGEAVTLVRYETYDQLRDYSDVAAIARVETIRVARAYEEANPMPGELEVELSVDVVLGGRFDTAPGDRLTMLLPLHATEEIVAQVQPRLERLEGTARYAVFLTQMVEPERDPNLPVRFFPNMYNAPPAILAEWPGDGRLTDIPPHEYLAQEAIERGEARTGTSISPAAEWEPTFPDRPPIGMTVADTAADFANVGGQPQVAPPDGWERLESQLAPVP